MTMAERLEMTHRVILSEVEGSHGDSDDSVCGVLRLHCVALRMTIRYPPTHPNV
jgi:hypothetical protein